MSTGTAAQLTDRERLAELKRLAQGARRATGALLQHLGEEEGALNLGTLRLLATHLTPPGAPVPLPPARRPIESALAADRYQIRFTASAETCEKLRLARDLLRHTVPNGDTGEIFDRALTVLLDDLARRKLAATDRPGASRGQADSSRHVPSQVKRAVWLRDEGRCAFVGRGGRRCLERGFLEFHHVKPFAAGGPATTGNIQLRCRAHNAYEAELYFGPREPPGGEGMVGEASRRWVLRKAQLGPDRVGRRPRATG